ncbi:DUF2306 domain-containing protein [Micromonospora sp. DT31]|uniref:DUF2306 domain-containing protein n=1 Tax=Micromonospora sp. DT31 TaxID=3393434 RepID=UPI003CED6F11
MTRATTVPKEAAGDSLPAPEESPAAAPRRQHPWWRRPWILPLTAVVLVFLYNAVPRYWTFDKAQSLIPQPGNFELHYPLLVGHVTFGTIALATTVLQVWPWLRRRHPRIHRISGRLYVFAGVLPSAVLAVSVGVVSLSGPSVRVSSVISSSLWVACTLIGWRMIRQGRQTDHRRWMIRSFALTMSIVMSRVLGKLFTATILPMPDTTDLAQLAVWGQSLAGLAVWPGWILPLLFAEWWVVERGSGRRYKARTARRIAAGAP